MISRNWFESWRSNWMPHFTSHIIKISAIKILKVNWNISQYNKEVIFDWYIASNIPNQIISNKWCNFPREVLYWQVGNNVVCIPQSDAAILEFANSNYCLANTKSSIKAKLNPCISINLLTDIITRRLIWLIEFIFLRIQPVIHKFRKLNQVNYKGSQ